MLSKVQEVFTKEYRNGIEYRDFLLKELRHFRLNNTSENVEDKVGRLTRKNFVSSFRIKLEKTEWN